MLQFRRLITLNRYSYQIPRNYSCRSFIKSPQIQHTLPLKQNIPTFRNFASKNTNSNKDKANNAKPSNSNQFSIQLTDITKKIEHNKFLFENLSLTLLKGAKIGVVGPNGAGKSTLLKILADIDDEYEGEVKKFNVEVGYLAQEPELDDDLDVRGNILEGVREKKEILEEYLEKEEEYKTNKSEEIKEELEELKEIVENENLRDLDRKIEVAINALRCPPGNASVENLSGGEKRRVALCRLLISQPDVLLLDEPTNHLDTESVAWLERYLKEYKGTVMTITHDRYFLDNITNWILELDRGKPFIYKGNYSKYLLERQKRYELEAKQETNKIKSMKEELEWIKQSPKARQSKSKARIATYEKMVETTNKLQTLPAGNIIIPPGPRLGNVVVHANNITKKINDRILFENLTFIIPPGAIVGIIGPNGSGKSTLLNILIGESQPDSGVVKLGGTVKMAYVSQSRVQQLDPDNTIYEEVSQGQDTIYVGQTSLHTRTYLAAFNFKGSSQNKLVSALSGGERNRVQLAKMLKEGPNLIILDEPTNDLDVDVLRSLEEALQSFVGSAIIVSHDRWFLDRLCSHILAFEKDQIIFFEGNYQEYEEDKRKRLGDSVQRFKFVKIEKV